MLQLPIVWSVLQAGARLGRSTSWGRICFTISVSSTEGGAGGYR